MRRDMDEHDAGRRSGESARRDQGSAILLTVGAVAVAGLVALGAARIGAAMVQRQRAQVAADAAALAGVEGGRDAAARLAAINGGQLIQLDRAGWIVTVVVTVGDASAQASASNGP
jgi:hypothetical protein